MTNFIQQIPFFGMLSRFHLFHDHDRLKGSWMRPSPRMMEDAPKIGVDHLSVNDQGCAIRAEIPGTNKENVKVQVDGNRVSITAEVKRDIEEKTGDKIICSECFRGSSFRSLTLDADVDEEKAEARYDNGVLELLLPRKNGSIGRQLQVK